MTMTEKEFYKNQINETIDKLDDTELLVYLYLFISAKIKSKERGVIDGL